MSSRGVRTCLVAKKRPQEQQQQQQQGGLTHSNRFTCFPAVHFYFICFHTCQLFLLLSNFSLNSCRWLFLFNTQSVTIVAPTALFPTAARDLSPVPIECFYTLRGYIHTKLPITYNKKYFTSTYKNEFDTTMVEGDWREPCWQTFYLFIYFLT